MKGKKSENLTKMQKKKNLPKQKIEKFEYLTKGKKLNEFSKIKCKKFRKNRKSEKICKNEQNSTKQ